MDLNSPLKADIIQNTCDGPTGALIMGAAVDRVPTVCRHAGNYIHILFCILTLSLPGMDCTGEESVAQRG